MGQLVRSVKLRYQDRKESRSQLGSGKNGGKDVVGVQLLNSYWVRFPMALVQCGGFVFDF